MCRSGTLDTRGCVLYNEASWNPSWGAIMATRKIISKSSKHLKKGKKLEETKPLKGSTGAVGAGSSGGKHVLNPTIVSR
jgi:hypothetical protein